MNLNPCGPQLLLELACPVLGVVDGGLGRLKPPLPKGNNISFRSVLIQGSFIFSQCLQQGQASALVLTHMKHAQTSHVMQYNDCQDSPGCGSRMGMQVVCGPVCQINCLPPQYIHHRLYANVSVMKPILARKGPPDHDICFWTFSA